MTRRKLELEIKTYVRLPRSVYDTIDELARKKGLAISQFLRMLILEKLKEIEGDGND